MTYSNRRSWCGVSGHNAFDILPREQPPIDASEADTPTS